MDAQLPRSSAPRFAVFPLAGFALAALLAAASAPRDDAAANPPPAASPAPAAVDAGDPHASWLESLPPSERRFPSARSCAKCHVNIYEEWSTSQHAYAAISPMFHKFEQTLNELASGTVGAFCVRCHISAGTSLGELRDVPVYERAPVSIEGVTCVSCHRVSEKFGKMNGERGLVEGPLTSVVYGSTGAPDLKQEIAQNDLATTDGTDGRPRVHSQAIQNDQIGKSEFCVSCHQVAVHPDIKLEVVWEQYRDSPACANGVTCQDCHMGPVPGKKSDHWLEAPRAVVDGKPIKPGSKHTDHAFVGPGYAIAHPGIFPHNLANPPSFTVQKWMSFDWRAAWGSDEFEAKLAKGETKASFPAEWADESDRRDAWGIVNDNLKRLRARNARRLALMELGSRLDGPFFDGAPQKGRDLEFSYLVSNVADGHNLPSGSLGAQPEIWLDVALLDPDGHNVWESGYCDSHGDQCDLHSKDVIAGVIDHDAQLFSLQTKFLTTNLKGTDREMYLPVPFDADQLPYIRPPGTPNSVMNHPPTIRMEQRSIPPLGDKRAHYSVDGSKLEKPGKYRLVARMRSRAEPMYFMEFCGATREMLRDMNANMIDFHEYAVEFDVR